MCFVLNIRHKGKDIAVAVDCDLAARIVHNGAGAVVVVLDHTEGGDILQRRAAQGLPDCADLPPAAVDEQQVRQGGKLVLRAVRLFPAAGRLVFRRTAGERLCQRGIVVRARDGAHLKAAIAGTVGFAVPEHDHAADAGAIAPVGDVVAFDNAGRLLQAKQLGGLLQQLFLAGVTAALTAKALHGIGVGHCDQLCHIAALRHIKLDLCAAGLIQRLIQCLGIGRQGVHRDGSGDVLTVQIILRQKLLPHGVDVGGIVENKFPLVGQAAVPVAQHSGADRVGRAGQRDNIHLGIAVHNDLLACGHTVNGHDLVAQQGGRFKVKTLGGGLHLIAQLLDDVLFAVADHPQRALYCIVVGLTADFAAAHCHALSDVGIQAGAALAKLLREALAAAGQQKAILRCFHHLPHGKR